MIRRSFLPSKRRGFTLVEVCIASAVAAFVFGMVGFLQISSIRVSKKLTAYSRTQGIMCSALDQVMFRLCMGRAGAGNITIAEDGHRLDFIDPNKGGAVSSFRFAEGILYYDEDIASGEGYSPKVRRLENLSFELLDGATVVRVTSKATAIAQYTLERPIEKQMSVYLRN
ncbi:prepilin-type N-terminal cleavage/methylation domain-containing protein [Candidatus Sumerlaeota bacterium]|nr:prepilin-type N-terminal cleavage/methylation domain-containing protein [Candidatus Sumerlaeota bacterium]